MSWCCPDCGSPLCPESHCLDDVLTPSPPDPIDFSSLLGHARPLASPAPPFHPVRLYVRCITIFCGLLVLYRLAHDLLLC